MVSSDIKKTLSIFSLSCFVLGVLGSIALSAFNEEVAGIFAVVAALFTIVFGIVSWKEKLGRIIVYIALGAIVIMVFLALYLRSSSTSEKSLQTPQEIHQESWQKEGSKINN